MGALPLYEKEAKARQRATLKRGSKPPVMAKMPQQEKGKAREKAAQDFGVSPRYVQAAKAIQEFHASAADHRFGIRVVGAVLSRQLCVSYRYAHSLAVTENYCSTSTDYRRSISAAGRFGCK